jgi:membrane-bound lytic murein transglycosylase D
VVRPADRSRGWWWGGGARRGVALASVALAAGLFLASGRTATAEVLVDFPTPAAMAPAVRFWVDVFTRYTCEQAVIHDRLEPWVVYQVVSGSAADVALQTRGTEEQLALVGFAAGGLIGFQPVGPLPGAVPVSRVRVQRGLREAFAAALAAQRLYRPVVERALRREGLPEELGALPLVESSYHPAATSRAGAVGLWQFTPETGRRYLKIARGIDERRDPVRASDAAARHLRELREALPSWPLALTAYNRGLTGVLRARQAIGSDDLGELVARYRGPGFGFASRNYYAEFLAALHVMRHAAHYFPELAPVRMVEYRVRRGDTLLAVARRHRVSLASLRITNGLRSAPLQPGQRILIRL